MNSTLNSLIKSKKFRPYLILLIGLLLFGTMIFHKDIFFAKTLKFTVTENDAAASCNRYPTLMRKKYRSSVPNAGYSGYCGAILTDMGHYKLKPNLYDKYIMFNETRQNLHAKLKAGCAFTATVVGYGPKFKVGDKPRYPIRQRITKILEEHGCESS